MDIVQQNNYNMPQINNLLSRTFLPGTILLLCGDIPYNKLSNAALLILDDNKGSYLLSVYDLTNKKYLLLGKNISIYVHKQFLPL